MNFEDYSPYTRYVLQIWGARVDAYAAESRKLRALEDAELTALLASRAERTEANTKAVIAAAHAVMVQQERTELAKYWCDLAKDAFDESYRYDRSARAGV